jgi:hypothetical protein
MVVRLVRLPHAGWHIWSHGIGLQYLFPLPTLETGFERRSNDSECSALA